MALTPVEQNQISLVILEEADCCQHQYPNHYTDRSSNLFSNNKITEISSHTATFTQLSTQMNTLMPQFDLKHQSTSATMSSAADTLMLSCSPSHMSPSSNHIYFDFSQLHQHYPKQPTNNNSDLVASSTESSENEKEPSHYRLNNSVSILEDDEDDEDEDDEEHQPINNSKDYFSSDDESLQSSSAEEESDLDDSDDESTKYINDEETLTSSEYEDDSEEEEEDDDDEDSQINYNLRKSSSSLVIRKYFFNCDDDDEDEDDEDDEEDDYDNASSGSCSSDLSLLDEFEDLMPPTFTITSPIKDICASPRNPTPTKNQFYVETEDENEEQYTDDEDEEANKQVEQDIHNALRYSINNGPIAKCVPWWFDNEDEDHVQQIMKEYSNFLQLDNEIKRIRRAPKPFVGRVHRRVLQFESKRCNEFVTIDTVKLYRWEIQPIGRPLKPYKTALLLTTWDKESGFPISFQPVESLSMKEYWMQASCSSNILQSSYLYCSPVFDRSDNYLYSVGTEKYPVDYLPSSPSLHHNNSHHHEKRSSSPSLILSSHIYSHSLIPQHHFSLKDTSNDDS